jgi:hypothetical protein
MSLPVKDGVAEDAALLRSDPLPVTDADSMEGDVFSYHVEGSGGTMRAYRYLKRPSVAVKKQQRDYTVNSRTSQASVVSTIYVYGTGIVRKCCNMRCMAYNIGHEDETSKLSPSQLVEKDKFIRRVCSTRNSIYSASSNQDEERDKILNILKLGHELRDGEKTRKTEILLEAR